jgi:hypothetical protein
VRFRTLAKLEALQQLVQIAQDLTLLEQFDGGRTVKELQFNLNDSPN